MERRTIENDEISLKELFVKIKKYCNYLLSKWKLILLASIIGACFGLGYSFIKKPIYTATLSFALEDEKASGGGLGGALGLAGSLGLDLGGGGGSIFSGSNLTELFKSRTMVEKTLLRPVTINDKKTSLAEMYIQNNKWREEWKGNLQVASIEFLPSSDRRKFTRAQDSILGLIYGKLLKDELTVGQRDKKISIISIDVSSNNELFAKYFCEELVKEVGAFYVDTKSKKARINMDMLEHQVDSIKSELNGSITGVAVANDNTFNLNPAMNVRKAPSARRQVDVQANTAILTELVKQSELAKVNLRKETPLIQVIDRPIFPLAKNQFGKIKGIVFGAMGGFFLIIIIILFKTLIQGFKMSKDY